VLDRCRYGAFTGSAPVDALTRLVWLGLQEPARWGIEFWPQPYEQLAKVLREMGHGGDARTVLIEKERLQRKARQVHWQARLDGARLRLRVEREGIEVAWPAIVARIGGVGELDPRRRHIENELRKSPAFLRAIGNGGGGIADGIDHANAAQGPVWAYWWRLNLLRIWDGVVGATIGYGRQPQRAALWAAGFLLFGWLVFAWAGGHDEVRPNAIPVLRGAEWTECAVHPGYRSQLACYWDRKEASSYPRFNALVYSADALLPFVDLEMRGYWIPDERGWRGWLARNYLWFHIAAGWALSLLAVAGFSGLIKSD
jgi:hypothetical protein